MQCQNCGAMMNGPMCQCCGWNAAMMNSMMQERERMWRERRMWRIIFVIAELASFFIALFLCWLFAHFMETDLFERQNWLILAVWVGVAYWIYKKLYLRIR